MTDNANSTTSHPANRPTNTPQVEAAAHDAATRRRASAAWISGGALWAVAGLLYAASGWQFRASSAMFLTADVLLIAGIIGLLSMCPHGSSRFAAAALGVALAARIVFAVAEVTGLVTATDNTVLLPIAGLLTGLSTIAYGALARQAHRGLRAASAVMGLYFFVVMVPFAVVTSEPPALALAAWGFPAAFIGLMLERALSAPPVAAR